MFVLPIWAVHGQVDSPSRIIRSACVHDTPLVKVVDKYRVLPFGGNGDRQTVTGTFDAAS